MAALLLSRPRPERIVATLTAESVHTHACGPSGAGICCALYDTVGIPELLFEERIRACCIAREPVEASASAVDKGSRGGMLGGNTKVPDVSKCILALPAGRSALSRASCSLTSFCGSCTAWGGGDGWLKVEGWPKADVWLKLVRVFCSGESSQSRYQWLRAVERRLAAASAQGLLEPVWSGFIPVV